MIELMFSLGFFALEGNPLSLYEGIVFEAVIDVYSVWARNREVRLWEKTEDITAELL